MTEPEPTAGQPASPLAPPGIDTTVAHPARMLNYVLGGTANFPVDRETAERRLKVLPGWRTSAQQNRQFHGRAIRLLAHAGITQFLDIGAGLPAAETVHGIAQTVNPACRVAYVDSDPLVLVHARTLLPSRPEGRISYSQADLREPDRILADPDVRGTLDLSQPVALMLLAVLHFIPDADDPVGIVRTLLAALPAGSYLVASHPTQDFDPARGEQATQVGNRAGVPVWLRTRAEFTGFFAGLDLLDPGVALVSDWRPDPGQPRPEPHLVTCYGAVARKP
jgi:S-adenosyl methyltransferase